MSLRHHRRVVALALALGFKQAWGCKIEAVGSFIIYTTIMVVWSGIIKMLPMSVLDGVGMGHADMIWYLGATEYLLFSCPSWGFKQVQTDLETGQAHLGLLRPYPDSLLRIALWCGESLFRIPTTLVVFALCCWVLSGTFALTATGLAMLLLALPLAVFMAFAGVYIVGVSCLWFVQAEPAFWVWQKCLFLLGAMIWPMAFYPDVMQTLMWFTPFPAILSIAGDWITSGSWRVLALHLGHQLVWALVFMFLLRRLDGVVLRHIQRKGG